MKTLLSLHSFLFIILSILPSLSAAYSWHFNSPPTQCSNLSLTIAGTDGVPPYNILIVPYGPSPLSSNVEVRSVIDLSFDGGSTFEFPINYPGNSRFVVVVSDATGFGSGGTSAPMRVKNSNEASCFNPTKQASTLFPFYLSPDPLCQCQQTRIWWEKVDVQGSPVFHGVIPGGQSFSIASSNATDKRNMGRGFSWTPPIRAGTLFFIIGGDNRGIATAGGTPHVVQHNRDNSCLNDTSLRSTLGGQVGWNHPAGMFQGMKSASAGRVTVGLLIGGIMAGVTPICIAALYYFTWRRRRLRSRPRLLIDGIDGGAPNGTHRKQSGNGLAERHRLEPFPLFPPEMDLNTCTTQKSNNVQGFFAQLNWPPTRERSQNRNSVELNHSRHGFGTGCQKHDAWSSENSVAIVQNGVAGPGSPLSIRCEIIEPPPAYSRIQRATQLLKMLA